MSVEMKTLTLDDTTFLVMDKNLRTRINGRIDKLDSLNIDLFPQYEIYGLCWVNLGDSIVLGTKPASSGQGVLITLEQSSNYARQMFIGSTTYTYKARLYTKSTATWGAWNDIQLRSKIGDLTQLNTTTKTSLVDAINELYGMLSS